MEAPTYEMVCADQTGHAEAVEITFDPTQITYQELLRLFWDNHNPTTLNQQGPDYGSQYRSAIFFHTEAQRIAAEASKVAIEQSGRWKRPIVTQIVAAQRLYEAEAYHQQYLHKRGLGSCHM